MALSVAILPLANHPHFPHPPNCRAIESGVKSELDRTYAFRLSVVRYVTHLLYMDFSHRFCVSPVRLRSDTFNLDVFRYLGHIERLV